MTDKQIIIDGINVRECACIIEDYYYQQANNLANGYKHIKNVCELGETGSEYYRLFCKDNPNCYYKQLKQKERECEELRKTVMYKCPQCSEEYLSPIGASLYEENKKYKQALNEIIRFFKEDEKFARYSGRPIIFTKPTLEKIEKILKENDIKIS